MSHLGCSHTCSLLVLVQIRCVAALLHFSFGLVSVQTASAARNPTFEDKRHAVEQPVDLLDRYVMKQTVAMENRLLQIELEG